MAQEIKIMGVVVGHADGYEYVDDIAGYQAINFTPDSNVTNAPAADFILFDMEEGIWRTYDDKGETKAEGRIFNLGPIV